MEGKIVSINISRKKGVVKEPIKSAVLKEDYGIEGDAHSGKEGSPGGIRQVSLLGSETINRWLKDKNIKIKPGDFAENLTTTGIEWKAVPVGGRIKIGAGAELQITQIGKPCHSGCAIKKLVGDCIMPREGVFSKAANLVPNASLALVE